MQDDKNRQPDQEPEGQERRSSPLQPYSSKPKPASPAEEPETISLLDLMGEEAQQQGAPPPVPPEAKTVELPPLSASNPPARPAPAPLTDDQATPTAMPPLADQATPTAAPPGQTPPTQGRAQRPLSRQEWQTPESTPTIDDTEATRVQPRVAFPGATQQRPDQPTADRQPPAGQPPRPIVPPPGPPPSDAQTVVRPRSGYQAPPAAWPQQPAGAQPPAQPRPPAAPPSPPRRDAPKVATPPAPPVVSRAPLTAGRIARGLMVALLVLVVGSFLVASLAAVGYSLVASDLPRPTELRDRASTFETARIYDRNGQLLYALADPNAGNRTYVTLDRISPYLVQATISTEDKRFYDNPGFDPIGLVRAVVMAAREQEAVAGTSTITQQLVRATLLDEDERTERSYRRKVREIILAAEISRTYEKNEILELYLNEIYYGNLAYGIEAAANTYFNKSAAELTLAEASLLAGLPQAPALWDPYTAPDKALGRQREVLSLMVSNGDVTLEEAQAALNEMAVRVYELEPQAVTIRHPHFTFTVLQQAEELLGAQSIYRGGLSIQTTLDPDAQRLAEEAVAANRELLASGGANNAALVALQPQTGEILAMVGSADFNNEAISGQVNMALAPRQAGSS
ncbi:transglycosylase domain-containing protein, partial [Promineifilum sp.]|uniref:transglycosylase domain-containing protein n=1 Tax=Promineifilum sp. TaxID=2664178 RepID=UPI0035B477D5